MIIILGRVHLEPASSPAITDKWHLECIAEPIANFSDWAHIGGFEDEFAISFWA